MRFAVLLALLCLSLNAFAQNHDYIWFIGYSNNGDTASEGGGLKIDFNYAPPKMTKLNTVLNFQNYAAACADSSGELQFYSNGIRIYNKNYQLMDNGDTINPGDKWEDYNGIDWGYVGLSPVVLPDPAGKDKYYLIHTGVYIDGGVKYGPLYYTLIDMQANNGGGKVVTKNYILQQGSFSEPAAVKHANGRDWWVLLRVSGQPVILRYLISPEGITYMGEQVVPLTFPLNSGATRSRISPDGTKYAILSNFIALYDFDRCSGFLLNQKVLPFITEFDYNYLSFSTDSRFLYASNSRTITQYDLLADTITPTGLDTVQEFDYTNYPFPPFYAGFGDPVIAPDGKIYYVSTGTTAYLHPLHRPNLPGSSCDFEVAGIRLPRINGRTYYNFPNYHLGAMEGSPCDTIVYKKRPGFENTSYEAFLEQQTLSRRQVFQQAPPYSGKRNVPYKPEILEHLMMEELKKVELRKIKVIENDKK
jgi:hypothetical protein